MKKWGGVTMYRSAAVIMAVVCLLHVGGSIAMGGIMVCRKEEVGCRTAGDDWAETRDSHDGVVANEGATQGVCGGGGLFGSCEDDRGRQDLGTRKSRHRAATASCAALPSGQGCQAVEVADVQPEEGFDFYILSVFEGICARLMGEGVSPGYGQPGVQKVSGPQALPLREERGFHRRV